MINRITPLLLYSLLFSQQLELPKSAPNDQIVHHSNYTLNYSEKHEQAEWVAYTLSSSDVYGSVGRTNDFRADPKVKTGSASLADYKGSGYDRGHLAPAGDMKSTYTAMSESFYMSNMSPQVPSFNRGIWKKLESTVRNWAVDYQKVYIVTGAVLTASYPTIGMNNVSIPEFYYKVILDYEQPEIKGIGFILPNQKSSQSLQSYAVSVDEVERFTGIDFFHSLSDDIEEQIESHIDLNKWSFRSTKGYSGSSTYTTKQKKLKGQPKINVNNASKGELMRLPGIGDKLSDKIIAYRSVYGGFKTLDNLQAVKGIGVKTVAKLKPYATVYD
jgi:endonuclease G